MAKTTQSSKKLKSTKINRKLVAPFWRSKPIIILFVLAFGGLAAALLLRTSASPNPKSSPFKGVMVEYQTTVAALSATKDSSGNWNYNVIPTQARVLYSGELECNNSSTDSMNTVKLSNGEVRSLKQVIKNQFDSVKTAPSTGTGKSPSKVSYEGEGIVLINEDGTPYKAVGVNSLDKQAPAGFTYVKNLLKRQCQRANQRTTISKLPDVGAKPSQSILTAAVNHLSKKLTPVVYADYDGNVENGAYFEVNNHRGNESNSYGAPWAHPIRKGGYGQPGCMVQAARQVAYFNYSANIGKAPQDYGLFHSNANHMQDVCGTGWNSWGENLAYKSFTNGYSTTTAGFDTVIELLTEVNNKSPDNHWGHHTNIDSNNLPFTKIGNGAYIDPYPTYYYVWLAQEFASGTSGVYK